MKDISNLIDKALMKIPSDDRIKEIEKKLKHTFKYATPYYQGQFDALMELKMQLSEEKEEWHEHFDVENPVDPLNNEGEM